MVLLLALTFCAQGQIFQNPRFIGTAVSPAAINIADLDGNGLPDLIYDGSHASGNDDDPSVLHPLLANGKGGYEPGKNFTLPGGFSSACQSGDVNGDGKVDLVCSGYDYRGAVVVVPGRGDGSFGEAIIVPVQPYPNQLGASHVAAIADLNGDGRADLLVTLETADLLVPMLGDGTGHFTAATPLYTAATRIQIADLNGDGKPDMLAQGLMTPSTRIFLGKGDGNFEYGQGWPTYDQALKGNRDSILGDIDGDGHLDLIGGGLGIVRIYRGHGDGSFEHEANPVLDFQQGVDSEQLGFGVYMYPLACQDLNGDGIADLVALGENGLVVFPGKGGLAFGTPRAYPEEEYDTFGNYGAQLLQDVNGDGLPDYLSLGPEGLYLSYGQRDGSFVSGRAYIAGRHVFSAAAADFDEDGFPDTVTAGDLQMFLSLGNGDGTFQEAKALPAVSPPMGGKQTQGWVRVAAGDTNGDGHKDLLAIGATQDGKPQLFTLAGRGDGSFGAPTAVETVEGQPDILAIDTDRDGLEDIVLTAPGTVSVLLQQKGGGYRTRTMRPAVPDSEYSFTAPTVGDLNGDGIPDLAYVTDKHAAVAAGKGDGTFGAAVFYPLALPSGTSANYQGTVAIGDVDGDGVPDLAVSQPFSGPGNNNTGTQILVLYGQGKQGAFDANSFSTAVRGPALKQEYGAVYVADVDGDGRGDVIADRDQGTGYLQTSEVIRGRADRTLGEAINFVAGYGEAPLSFADLNGDGRADLLKPNTYGNAFTVLLTVQPFQPIGTLSAAPFPEILGAPFAISAALTADGQSGPFEGKVRFAVDGVDLGSVALVNGSASIAGPTSLSVGGHQMTATTTLLRDGQGSYAPVLMQGALDVRPLPVVVSVVASVNPVTAGQNTTVTVEIQNGPGSPAGAAQPTGQATVLIDGQAAGSGSSDGASIFRFSLPYEATALGAHTVTVTYPGDPLHATGTGSLQLMVTPVPGSFTVAVRPVAVNVAADKAAPVQVTVSSMDGFAGAVSLEVSGLPSVIIGRLDLSTVMLAPGGQATSTLLLTETATAQMQQTIPAHQKGGAVAFAAVLILLVPGRVRRKGLSTLLVLGLAGGVGLGLSGCSTPRPPESTSYTVTVTARATAAGAPQKPQSATFVLTVTR